MSGWPTNYRSGGVIHRVAEAPQALKESRGMTTLKSLEALDTNDIFRRLPRGSSRFGRRTAAELGELIAEQALRKSAARVATRLIPILGEVLILKDALDLIGTVTTTITEYPGGHYEPTFLPGHGTTSRPDWERIETPENIEDGYGRPYTITKLDEYTPDFGGYAVEYYRGHGTPIRTYAYEDDWPLTGMRQIIQLDRYNPDLRGQLFFDDYWYPKEGASPSPTVEPGGEPIPGPPVYVPGDPVTKVVQAPLFDEGFAEGLPGYREVGQDEVQRNENRDLRPHMALMNAYVTVVAPSGNYSNPGTHPLRPPIAGTKERKIRMSAKLAAFAALVAEVTEYDDAIASFWDTLPDSAKTGYVRLHGKKGKVYWKRRRKASPIEKTKDVYRHWDKVDIHDSFVNLAKNQIQDSLIGGASKRVSNASKPWYNMHGRPVGFMTGPAL